VASLALIGIDPTPGSENVSVEVALVALAFFVGGLSGSDADVDADREAGTALNRSRQASAPGRVTSAARCAELPSEADVGLG